MPATGGRHRGDGGRCGHSLPELPDGLLGVQSEECRDDDDVGLRSVALHHLEEPAEYLGSVEYAGDMDRAHLRRIGPQPVDLRDREASCRTLRPAGFERLGDECRVEVEEPGEVQYPDPLSA